MGKTAKYNTPRNIKFLQGLLYIAAWRYVCRVCYILLYEDVYAGFVIYCCMKTCVQGLLYIAAWRRVCRVCYILLHEDVYAGFVIYCCMKMCVQGLLYIAAWRCVCRVCYILLYEDVYAGFVIYCCMKMCMQGLLYIAVWRCVCRVCYILLREDVYAGFECTISYGLLCNSLCADIIQARQSVFTAGNTHFRPLFRHPKSFPWKTKDMSHYFGLSCPRTSPTRLCFMIGPNFGSLRSTPAIRDCSKCIDLRRTNRNH